MWNFGVYSDNIRDAICESIDGITVGFEAVRAIIYADDISPVTASSNETNAVLQAISKAGTFNAYKFKPSKCKVLGSKDEKSEFTLGGRSIERADFGLMLGTVVNGKGISTTQHVLRRAKMVSNAIKLIKSWRTRGLPFKVAFRNLFLAKILPRFTYAFSLIPSVDCGRNLDSMKGTLGRALCSTFGWRVPKRFKIQPSIWFVVCGFPCISALLRKLKLDLAARLMIRNSRAGKIFRKLYVHDRGFFERDVHQAVDEWLLTGIWNSLSERTVYAFRRKVLKISLKCWPKDLTMTGNLSWLYHNHSVFSGNVPKWADWEWPKSDDVEIFKLHFYSLLTGQHPAGGGDACCSNLMCKNHSMGPLYDHHFFECTEYSKNRCFFRGSVKGMYNDYVRTGSLDIPKSIINSILVRPCLMWVGLFDSSYFDLGLKLSSAHELHRILTISSILSWGRFYPVP